MVNRVLICRSNPIAPDPRVEKEARCLQKAGFQVSVLGWDRSASLPVQENMNGIRIFRLPIKAEYARGVMNFFPLLRWQFGLLGWLLRHHDEFGVIHACDFDTVLPALLCKLIFRQKVIYDIFDFYAEHLRATPEWIKRMIRTVDLWAVGHADAVILVDDARREQIAGAAPRRLAVIYNSPEDHQPEHINAYADHSYQLKLAYIGLLQIERGLLDMLDVLSRHPEWGLDLAGFGGDETRILEVAKNLPNVVWHGRIPYPTALGLSAEADVLFALYDPSIPNHRYSSPNKLFEAMMLGKPIIVARGTNMDRIAAQQGFGLLVEYGDILELESAILQLVQDERKRKELGERARLSYDQVYGWHIMEQKLVELYQQIH